MFGSIFGIIIASMLAFLSTSIDDLFILTLHFATSNEKFDKKDIIHGHFIGISILILVSLLPSLGFMTLPSHYIGFLGLIPIYRGIDLLFHFNRELPLLGDLPENRITVFLRKFFNYNLLLVAMITLANGGDNLALYLPLFSSLKWHVILVIPLFFLYTHYWVKLGEKLVGLKQTTTLIKKYGHIFIPYSMILIGIYLIQKNGTIEFLFG